MYRDLPGEVTKTSFKIFGRPQLAALSKVLSFFLLSFYSYILKVYLKILLVLVSHYLFVASLV